MKPEASTLSRAAARKRIRVQGIVQGVGFRPFVYRLAHAWGLTGWVLNHSGGVDIEVEGPSVALEGFTKDLRLKAPPVAHIERVVVEDAPPEGSGAFEIRHSQFAEGEYPLVSPDIATCADCLRELFDPSDRRYLYPFINCTNCGPRFTIIESMPYDRPRTTMRDFHMCPQCQKEYDDPLDRRFHAQPNACPVCGPRLRLLDAKGQSVLEGVEDHYILAEAARLLLGGRILAIKGLGGFHLACDATNVNAVRLLRARKRRPDKPLAVMMASVEEVARHCEVSQVERALLLSSECPIVLLRWRQAPGTHHGSGSDKSSSPILPVVSEVAPGNHYLGVMLPYTPLHHILLRLVGRPLVMTSGNLSEEPIAQDNDEALRRLGNLADFFVVHNRGIYARYDDSVWFVPELVENVSVSSATGGPRFSTSNSDEAKRPSPQPLRRARGYAPFPIRLPVSLPSVLAVGAELKNTFCLARDQYAFLSQHIGDMENLETLEHFETTIALYEKLFMTSPKVIAHDLHPDYLATRYAQERVAEQGSRADDALKLIAVQHHHAHIAACLADNGWPEDGGPVIGVCLDGTGYGVDGHIWGGELMVADYRAFKRLAHLEYMPLPGGDAAVRHPARLAVGYLRALFGPSWRETAVGGLRLACLDDLSSTEAEAVCVQIERELNTPLTSSMGRLFDAVSALVGVRQRVTYEAQAAIELEMRAMEAGGMVAPNELPRYPLTLTKRDNVSILGLRPLFEAVLADMWKNVSVAEIALQFHFSIATAVARTCEVIAGETGLGTVALSGGCFQNRLLLEMTVRQLIPRGFRVLTHRQVPCNDGCIALGQAVVAGFCEMH